MTVEVDIGEAFIDFLVNYRDNHGRAKYYDYVREEVLPERKKSVYVDYPDLFAYNQGLAEKVLSNPEGVLEGLEARITNFLASLDSDYVSVVPRVHLRLRGVYPALRLREIRRDHVNKLVALEGVVVKLTPIKQRIVKATFCHGKCGAKFQWPEVGEMGEVLDTPQGCPVCKKGGRFDLVEEETVYVDWQKAVVQERPEEIPAGQLPRQLEVIMEDDLVDSARPGDRVKLVGLLGVKVDFLFKKGTRSVFDMYLKLNSVDVSQKVLDEVSLSEEDMEKIRKIASDPWIKERIIASIAPSIYGHWEIKEGIALALFGGVPRVLQDGTKLRGDIHVLIVGDPGTAKSQMLQFAARVAPRSVYTTGKGSTAAGLTAAVVREKQSGDFYLEAGAMVLGDGGVAIIDEIDKMRDEDRVAIHEAMEQQTVSIAKAGIVAKLNARAAVIAAGNPKFGRYIQERGVSDNINLPTTILSRFDLIFILKDKPGEQDSLLATHILGMRGGAANSSTLIDVETLKKYIAFSRKYVHPRLSDEAIGVLKDFFIEMRKRGGESPDSPIAITARQLEALIRISEAYARMSLRSEVTRDDAERSVNIVRIFLENVGIDMESGNIDIDVVMTGKPKSLRDRTIKVLEIIGELAGPDGCAQVKDILEEAERAGIERKAAERIIGELRKGGEIFEKTQNCFRKT